MRIVVAGGGTGGHLYPGLAIARALVRLDPAVKPFFVGALRGVEREVLPRTEFPHELLDLHPLYRSRPWQNWRTLAGAVGAWRRVARLARSEPVRLVVGTGGYASGLVLAYAAAHRIPAVLQEQNSYPGLTMRAFSRMAREIYLGFPEGGRHLRPGRSTMLVDSGNPIEPPPSPPPDRAKARAEWSFPPRDGRVLLVVGGSQGARAVNEAVAAWIDRGLPPGVHVIWATGTANFESLARYESKRVRVRAYLSPIAEAYAASDLAVGRAGAMTTAELCAWGIPSILIPLPSAAADHQTANARALAAAGAAEWIPQRELTAERLGALAGGLLTDAPRLRALADAARRRGRPDAAQNIARRILALLTRDGSRS
ncbi:MAG TPA: UDP-N-acetylglucosamine--N-acetylmuramyl-(pentapeptide) pyrophosphoryl-undecaprenol N-acetylglucosamine transferase [Gemmatimonadaceae bacterium]|nr:UDP-N-acetylglucosamine--N-acetylmuramyl-(pentapeptide) pyrophosphoryl-undecaprenol N-acetylglucosamine transferase [Gemmatimonadaceae bacterium]